MSTAKAAPADSATLARLIARIADTKYFLGRQFAEWCVAAPTLESAVAAAAMAQDELGHARALYPLLRTLDPAAGAENEPETRTAFANMAVLDTPFADWNEFVAANFLVDGAVTTLFASATDSSYEPLAGRSRKALQEEHTHAMHAEGWVRRLAQADGRERAALEAALRRAWWDALCWLGPAGDDDELARAGVLSGTPDQLRQRFLAAVGPTILSEGLALPVRENNDVWLLTEPIPWGRWDPATYRLRPEAGTAVPATNAGAESRA